MATDAIKECSALARPFNKVTADMRTTSPLLDELLSRGFKMQKQFEATSASLYAFYEVLQKIADLASGARGATRDAGALLTKLAMRHRAIAQGFSNLSSTTNDDFLRNFALLCDDTRRSFSTLERDHDKDLKKWKSDLRKSNETILKLSKAASKKKANSRDKEDMEDRLEESLQNALEMYKEFENFEQTNLRNAMLEERRHYCGMLNCLNSIVKGELSVTDEISHLQGLQADSELVTSDPDSLPEASEMVIEAVNLDINRLFKETRARSNIIADATKESDEKRKLSKSFLSLLSGDSASSAPENGETGSDSSQTGVAVGSPNGLSQDAIRMEPDGSSRSEDPTPDLIPSDGPKPVSFGLVNGIAEQIARLSAGSPLPPPPPCLTLQCPSNGDEDGLGLDDLPPPPVQDDEEAFPMPPPPPPPEVTSSPDLPPPPAPVQASAWQPPQSMPTHTLASQPVVGKPRERTSSLSSLTSSSGMADHKRIFPPVPPKTARKPKPPVAPPQRTVSMYPDDSIYAVPPTQAELASRQQSHSNNISSIYFTSMRSDATPPLPPHPADTSPVTGRSVASSAPLYASLEQIRYNMPPPFSPPGSVEEPLYATLGRKLATADMTNQPSSSLSHGYSLRGSQNDLYHQSYASIGAMATLPRSRSVVGMQERGVSRPRSNTTGHHPSVPWQGSTQSVDV